MLPIKKYSPRSHKIKAVVYGPSGCGKTTFGGTCPKPIFASAEGGLLSIAHLHPDYMDIHALEDLKELYKFLKTEKHPYETVVIDSITEINEVIKANIEKKNGRAMQLQDWGTLAKIIRDILRLFRDLDMHVVFIAQESIDKDGDKIQKIVPNLNGKASEEIAYFMDIVGYFTVDPITNERKILTNSNGKTVAKDRTGQIKNDTEANFMSWVEKVNQMDFIDAKDDEPEQTIEEEVGFREQIESLLITLGYGEKLEEGFKKAASMVKKENIEDLDEVELKKVVDALTKKAATAKQAEKQVAKKEEEKKPSKKEVVHDKVKNEQEAVMNDPEFQEVFGGKPEVTKNIQQVRDLITQAKDEGNEVQYQFAVDPFSDEYTDAMASNDLIELLS